MRRFGKPGVALTVVLLVCLCGCNPRKDRETAVSQPGHAETDSSRDPLFNQTILKVGDRSYSNADFRDYFQTHYAHLDSFAFTDEVTRSIFDRFVIRQVLMKRIRQEDYSVGPGELDRFVQSYDTSPQTSIEEIKNDFLMQKYLVDVVYKDIEISEQEILDYYQAHRSDYRRKAQVLVYQIKTATSQEALEIRHLLLKDPDRFEELARARSVSQDADRGGRMGYFEKGTLPKVIENYVFSLRRGDLSQIVESPYGFHIFKVTEIIRPRTLALYQVSDQIRQQIFHQKTAAKEQQLISRLKEEYGVEEFYADLYLLRDKLTKSKGVSDQ
jgi:hypothetical protein